VIARHSQRGRLWPGQPPLVVEREFAHPHNFRRVRIRYERYPVLHTALLVLACSMPVGVAATHYEKIFLPWGCLVVETH
jgi:hypothetical protein